MPSATLYNGIRLPETWPPRDAHVRGARAVLAPWLVSPPDLIPIDLGRQLFIDDFLIEETNLVRRFHRPTPHSGNPLLYPLTDLELNGTLMAQSSPYGDSPTACPFHDGVFYDPADRLFKMWYMAGWMDGMALATSRDGLNWERPDLDVVPGTNLVLAPRPGFQRDGGGIWMDRDAPADERFKMFIFSRDRFQVRRGGEIYTSADGIHWRFRTAVSPVGDNTTIFHNPFRRKWVYSIRSLTKWMHNHWQPPGSGRIEDLYAVMPSLGALGITGRTRAYRECDDLIDGAAFHAGDVVYWAGTDELDVADPEIGDPPQLYSLDAVAYESVMLGVFGIHKGPENSQCLAGRFPKTTDLSIGYSRDGFNWHRPDRTPFLAASRQENRWDRGYLHSVGGVCLVVGDELWFYYSGFSGISPGHGTGMYAGGSTGLATLRRDGFASMDADSEAGTLTTRPVVFHGAYLFVNLLARQGEMRVEVLDESGRPIAPFTRDQCEPISGDTTRERVDWRGAQDMRVLAGRPVRFRFHLTGGSLYAFWISGSPRGESGGYLAAGGPGFTGPRDMPR